MKIKKILFTALIGFLVTSCYDLTLEPKGVMGESELFGSEAGAKMFFAGQYTFLPIEEFLYMARNEDTPYRKGNGNDPWGTWEAMKNNLQNMSGEFVNSWMQINNDGADYWPYDYIRELNSFITAFPNYKANFSTEQTYNNLLGEAHFLRAFYYFGMAKRYGGVPIIKEAQNPDDDPQTLAVPRNTEYDTWKFIHDDLQFAIDNMSGPGTDGTTRANKYVAAALMSRTMLYAGTIAKYSQYLGYQNEAAYQQGFVGIDPSKASEFFQYSYDAGKIVEQGPYALYTAKYPDKAANFASLFLDPASTENIFIKSYTMDAHDGEPQKTFLIPHSWDAGMSPNPSMSSFVGSQSYPALDLMRMYDFPEIVNPDGTPKRFSKRSDIREGMEPRMRGCMYFSGDELRGQTFEIGRGLYKTFTWKASDVKDGIDTEAPNMNGNRVVSNWGGRDQMYEGIYIIPKHGTRNNEGGENNCLTGAFVRKYVNPDMPVDKVREHASVQPWIVLRLGEIYLNTAEACYELGKKTEAFDYIQKIRDRAGCKDIRPYKASPADLSSTYGYPIDENLQFIRDERYRELWGENQRWWDLRRWRVADRVYDRWTPRILSCYYIINEDKYIYLNEREMGNRTWTAEKKCYYQGIPQGEINKNSNLLPQNPLR